MAVTEVAEEVVVEKIAGRDVTETMTDIVLPEATIIVDVRDHQKMTVTIGQANLDVHAEMTLIVRIVETENQQGSANEHLVRRDLEPKRLNLNLRRTSVTEEQYLCNSLQLAYERKS